MLSNLWHGDFQASDTALTTHTAHEPEVSCLPFDICGAALCLLETMLHDRLTSMCMWAKRIEVALSPTGMVGTSKGTQSFH